MPTYWRTVPHTSIAVFLLGVFFIFATIGFSADLMNMGRQSMLSLFLSVFFYGFFAIGYAVAGFVLQARSWKVMIPIFIIQTAVLNLLFRNLPQPAAPLQMDLAEIARMHHRLTFSGLMNISAMVLGYSCFVWVSIVEGRRYFRVHAEMELAREIHSVLVPSIDQSIGGFEFYGCSIPSGEVGGDLVDVFPSGDGWMAYIADVSGHGVAPGVVMAMIKSAARMRLSSPSLSTMLLEGLNSVLHPLTKPEMFATMAYLAWSGEQLEYAVAAHPAILHYHADTNQVTDLTCANFPVGMFEEQQFESGLVTCRLNDLFVLCTDGLVEVTNSRDEQFGLEGMRSVLSRTAQQPLKSISDSLFGAVRKHGPPSDDQSILLVRRSV